MLSKCIRSARPRARTSGDLAYMANGEVSTTAESVIEALGDEAREMLEKTGNAETALERLHKVY